MFKSLVRTSKETQHFTVRNISWLMLFKVIISVCAETHTKPRDTKCSVTDYKAYGTCYHSDLKVNVKLKKNL
jgi:hypothetical protein